MTVDDDKCYPLDGESSMVSTEYRVCYSYISQVKSGQVRSDRGVWYPQVHG